MKTYQDLAESEWQIVHIIAEILVKEQYRLEPSREGIRTELEKVIAYLRTFVERPDAGAKFFTYLDSLVKYGRVDVGYTQKTPDYYHSIDKACTNYLKNYQNEPQIMLQILGWTARLMYYYQVNPSREIVPPPDIEIPKTVEEPTVAQNLQIEQILEVVVTNIKGKEVTYQMPEPIKPNKLTVKEPKKYQDLSVGQAVKVKITELKPDGSIRKVKCID